MDDLAEILRCPSTHTPLVRDPVTGRLESASGAAYDMVDDIGYFLEPAVPNTASARTRNFYEEAGWSVDSSGLYQDTKRFVDTRTTSLRFTRACMTRLRKYFTRGGRYLLDAGSGPIAHDELLQYGDKFEKRICVDLSAAALREARRKLGPRGIYLQGDLTNLPIQSDIVDAAMSYHVIYQLQPDRQAAAFREIWRVLKPGGIAVIVYWWPETKLAWRVERLARLMFGQIPQSNSEEQSAGTDTPDHNPLSLGWFTAQNWPFRYSFDTYRVVGNSFLRNSIPDNWRGAAFLEGLMAFQKLAPSYCGKYGLMPAIVVHKARSPKLHR